MKKNLLFLAILITGLATTAFADVKIKTRQTMSGQSYENTTFIKGKRQRTERNMGGMQMIDLTQCDLRRSVQISPMTKTYVVTSYETNETPPTGTPASGKKDNVVRAGGTVTTTVTIKDTGERKQMFGFTARHLIITMETVSAPDACAKNNSKMQTDGWYIDAEFALDCDQTAQYRAYTPQSAKAGCQDKYNFKQNGAGKRGFPLYEKMTMFDENGKETMSFTNEVVELSKATLNADLFDVPQGYREVSDASQMYSAQNYGMTDSPSMTLPNSGNASKNSNSGMSLPSNSNVNSGAPLGPKQAGTIRIGLTVKTGAVGEGITSADLAAAVQNTLGEYLKGTKIEIVMLEAKLQGLLDKEAAQKECDFVLTANVSHKKGGGGFGGMFGQAIAQGVGATGIGHTGSTVGNVAGQVATQAIVSAGQVSANVKPKDEITLEISMKQTGGAAILTKQFKAKAKSAGEDIISPVVEQAAEAIVGAAKK